MSVLYIICSLNIIWMNVPLLQDDCTPLPGYFHPKSLFSIIYFFFLTVNIFAYFLRQKVKILFLVSDNRDKNTHLFLEYV